jgi:hypothetical protein
MSPNNTHIRIPIAHLHAKALTAATSLDVGKRPGRGGPTWRARARTIADAISGDATERPGAAVSPSLQRPAGATPPVRAASYRSIDRHARTTSVVVPDSRLSHAPRKWRVQGACLS